MKPFRLLATVLLTALAVPLFAQYSQPFRPQVHFSPQRNWTNDPNGLVYYAGEYHLFFQYNPFGDQWGHMSWGHAVSSDLLHWQELPVAIPEADGAMIYTGSVVIDHGNTSGLCGTQPECMVAIYTANSEPGGNQLETQSLAYSLDRGRTWKKYSGNPVLDLHMADFRDPGVFRDEERKRWVMAVAVPKEHRVQLYTSVNLKQWQLLSEFGPAGDVAGDWECPNLLQIPAANGGGSIWAVKVGLNPGAPQGGSGEQYFLGSFDGTHFTQSTGAGSHGWTNYGKDDYCAISFNGLPKAHKPLLLGWMSNWEYASKLPTSPWRGQMSVVRELSYVRDADGLALRQQPVIAGLRGAAQPLAGMISKATPINSPFELDAKFIGGTATRFGLRVYSDKDHWTEIAFDRAGKQFTIDRAKSGQAVTPGFPMKTVAPLAPGRPFDLRLIVDRSSVEAFAQNGTVAMTDLVFPAGTGATITTFAEGGSAPAVSGSVCKLRSGWTASAKH